MMLASACEIPRTQVAPRRVAGHPKKRFTGLGEVTEGAVPVRLPLFVNTLDVPLRGFADHVFRPHAI